MDIRKELLKAHSLHQTKKIVRYIDGDKKRFAELVNVFLAGPYRVTQRAAWPMSIAVEAHPGLIQPHFKKLLEFTCKAEVHGAVKRNVLRMLQFTELPTRWHAKIAEISFSNLADRKAQVAIRVFAMSVLARLAKHHPEFKNELKVLIEDEIPFTSPAFSSRGRKVLKALESL